MAATIEHLGIDHLGPDAVVFKANLVSDAGEKSRGNPGGVVAMCPEVILGPFF